MALRLTAVAAWAFLALVVFLLLAGAAPTPSLPSLPAAGLLVGWLLPLSRLAMDLAAVGTVGCLLFAAVLGSAREQAQQALRTGSGARWCGPSRPPSVRC